MPAKYPEFRAEAYSWKDDGNIKIENYVSIVLNTDAIHYVIDCKMLNENGDIVDVANQLQSKRFWNSDYLYTYKIMKVIMPNNSLIICQESLF